MLKDVRGGEAFMNNVEGNWHVRVTWTKSFSKFENDSHEFILKSVNNSNENFDDESSHVRNHLTVPSGDTLTNKRVTLWKLALHWSLYNQITRPFEMQIGYNYLLLKIVKRGGGWAMVSCPEPTTMTSGHSKVVLIL